MFALTAGLLDNTESVNALQGHNNNIIIKIGFLP